MRVNKKTFAAFRIFFLQKKIEIRVESWNFEKGVRSDEVRGEISTAFKRTQESGKDLTGFFVEKQAYPRRRRGDASLLNKTVSNDFCLLLLIVTTSNNSLN